MIRRFLLLSLLLCSIVASAVPLADTLTSSGLTSVLQQVNRHNATLQTQRAKLQAAQLANGTSLSLPDPEVELAYLIGSPTSVPNRTNVSLTQTLDWGVLLGRRKALAQTANKQALAAYVVAQQNVWQQADEAYTQLVYYNKLCRELQQRYHQAQQLDSLYQLKHARGDINQLELNKVQLNASVSKASWQRAQAERTEWLQTLQRLNGGVPLTVADTLFPTMKAEAFSLPHLQQAVEQSALSTLSQQQLEAAKAQVAVARAEALPAFTIGFQGEYIKANNYSGLSLGFSLPLWGNTRRRVRQAQAEVVAQQLEADELKLTLQQQIAQSWQTAQRLEQTAHELQQNLALANSCQLLHRSFELGQISLIDYLLELTFYYDARTAQLEAERDAELAKVPLRSLLYGL